MPLPGAGRKAKKIIADFLKVSPAGIRLSRYRQKYTDGNNYPGSQEKRVSRGQYITSHQFQPDFGFTDSRSHLLR